MAVYAIPVRVDEYLDFSVRLLAEAEGVSNSAIIRRALDAYVADQNIVTRDEFNAVAKKAREAAIQARVAAFRNGETVAIG